MMRYARGRGHYEGQIWSEIGAKKDILSFSIKVCPAEFLCRKGGMSASYFEKLPENRMAKTFVKDLFAVNGHSGGVDANFHPFGGFVFHASHKRMDVPCCI
uniref:(northern house mosquito) hypothetical protein n=1 Tax=Culex pipiens TaxID=7175 RepID=A0A8D8B0I9_CULPI